MRDKSWCQEGVLRAMFTKVGTLLPQRLSGDLGHFLCWWDGLGHDMTVPVEPPHPIRKERNCRASPSFFLFSRTFWTYSYKGYDVTLINNTTPTVITCLFSFSHVSLTLYWFTTYVQLCFIMESGTRLGWAFKSQGQPQCLTWLQLRSTIFIDHPRVFRAEATVLMRDETSSRA